MVPDPIKPNGFGDDFAHTGVYFLVVLLKCSSSCAPVIGFSIASLSCLSTYVFVCRVHAASEQGLLVCSLLADRNPMN